MPGRNTSTSPASSRSARRTSSVVAASVRAPFCGGAQRTSTGNWRPSLATTGAGSSAAQSAGEALGVGRRRHRQDAQIGTQQAAGVEGEGEAEIGRQVALVHLVEDHHRDAGKLRIGLEATGQHTLGDDLDPGVTPDPPLVARLVTDETAGLGPGQRGQAVGGGASREAAGLQHDDPPAVEPRFAEEPQRDERGLAGAGRGDEHRLGVRGERRAELTDDLLDREVGGRDHPSAGVP